MTRILFDTYTASLVAYPRDDDQDVIGLDPRYLALTIHQQSHPEYDPATHRLEPAETIDIEALTVTRGWTVVELLPPVPPPDWARFKAAVLTDPTINATLAQALAIVPAAATALAPTLLAAEQGLIADFASAWRAVLAAAPLPAGTLESLVALATDCHLPVEFVAALMPANA